MSETVIKNEETQEGESSFMPTPTARWSWNCSTNQIQAAIKIYSPAAQQLILDCFQWCINYKISRDDFAKEVGFSGNMVYKVFIGKYIDPDTKEVRPPSDKMIDAMRVFLESEKNRAILGNVEFALTPTANRIFTACKLALESQTPVFIWGSSQTGKTTALERFTLVKPVGRPFYARMEAAGGLKGMLHRIAEAMGVSTKAGVGAVKERIIQALSTNSVLILDEVHQLLYTIRKQSYFSCLEVLREIYDRSKCGMVLCGTRLLEKSLSDERHGYLEQLFKRGVHKVILPPCPTTKDVSAILEVHGLSFPNPKTSITIKGATVQPYEVIKDLAREQGLKAITERIRYARKIAKDAPITLESFITAHLTIATEDQSGADDWK